MTKKSNSSSLCKNQKIAITGSEGLLGKEISKHLSKSNKLYKLDLLLGDDLTNEDFVKSWFKKNKVNCLVNCFAFNDHVELKQKRSTLFDISLESFDEFLHVNLTSLFSVCREFARNNKHGSIVNFSATTGIVSARPDLYDGGHKHVAYSVSKSGVVNLTKYLATHLAPNIRVNCVAPGGAQFNQSKKFIKLYSSHTPMRRMMNPKELNHIVDYLCSLNSSYVTGATFVVDGGWTIW